MDHLKNQQGNLVFETKEWELIDLSTTDYRPGRAFKIACKTPGDARVQGAGMPKKPTSETPVIPIFEGFNAYLCSAVLKDDGLQSPASDMIALFL